MTDKQIIFDDVDVKDCIAYAKSQTFYLGNTLYKQMEKICMVKNQPCKFFDCQFKQMARELKAKEQECEFSNLRIIQLQETLSQYETDLSTKDCIVETCKAQYKELKTENDLFRTCHDNEQAKRRKFEQCLTEIKEIAEKCCINQATLDCENYDNCEECGRISDGDGIQQILQKISEVKDD